jgi:hypothetical protein
MRMELQNAGIVIRAFPTGKERTPDIPGTLLQAVAFVGTASARRARERPAAIGV